VKSIARRGMVSHMSIICDDGHLCCSGGGTTYKSKDDLLPVGFCELFIEPKQVIPKLVHWWIPAILKGRHSKSQEKVAHLHCYFVRNTETGLKPSLNVFCLRNSMSICKLSSATKLKLLILGSS